MYCVSKTKCLQRISNPEICNPIIKRFHLTFIFTLLFHVHSHTETLHRLSLL